MSNTPGGSASPQSLGTRLRTMREKHRESLAEVSGAVEIDVEVLERIERGEQLPSEDVLLLLINHFMIHDEEATKLWDLAGYSSRGDSLQGEDAAEIAKQIAFVIPMDLRVVYTDQVHVTANNYGLVMNFMQTGGPGNQPLAVARVGMSHEHATSILKLLQETLAHAERSHQIKSLPPHSRGNQTSQ